MPRKIPSKQLGGATENVVICYWKIKILEAENWYFALFFAILHTGMQWKCLPIPRDGHGKPAIHYTMVYRVFAKWADDGSLWQAFITSVAHLSAEKHLDVGFR
jgi:hypothetical protein